MVNPGAALPGTGPSGAGAGDEVARCQPDDPIGGTLKWFIHSAVFTTVFNLYRAFDRRLLLTMRQTHTARHKVLVEYSSNEVPIVDLLTGEIRIAAVFIGGLGSSSLIYAEVS